MARKTGDIDAGTSWSQITPNLKGDLPLFKVFLPLLKFSGRKGWKKGGFSKKGFVLGMGGFHPFWIDWE